MMFKKGFTLAEILITLGIIGTVAAITIPMLINNYKKIEYVNQLKEGYSMLNQGFKLMMSVEGIDDFDLSELSNAISSHGADTDNYNAEQAAIVIIQKYFKKADLVSREYLRKKSACKDLVGKGPRFWNLGDKSVCTGNYNMYFYLPNGMAMSLFIYGKCAAYSNPELIRQHGGKLEKYCAMIDLDLNGEKGPNQWGRDGYRFILTQSGNVIPMRGKDLYIANGTYDETTIKNNIIANCNPKLSTSQGFACAARIIEVDNWKMDY